MKFETIATTTAALLGTALIACAQDQAGGPDVGTTGATVQSTDDVQNETARQDRPADPQAADRANRSDQQQAEQQRADQQARQQDADEPELSEAQRAERAQKLRDMNWDDAEEAEVQLSELPERARDTLNNVASGAALNDQVTKLTKDNYKVFRATVSREAREDLHIFVRQDGTVVKTKQKIEFSDAPEDVRTTISEEMGGSDAQPEELHRIIADEETYYVATTGREGTRATTLRVDNTGNLMEAGDQDRSQQDRMQQRDRTQQDRTRQDRTQQDRTQQDRTQQDRTQQDRMQQGDRTQQDRTGTDPDTPGTDAADTEADD